VTRKGWINPAGSEKTAARRPGAVKPTTLADVVSDRTARPRRAPQCRICLAPETFVSAGRPEDDRAQSSLSRGICRDRAACEARQPTLDLP
jgi:hypothetical protein